MVVKRLPLLLLLLIALTGCAVVRGDGVTRIALLAPFEGRYREVGYDMLYAARLGLAESDITGIELLAVDDGGDTLHAADRARALSQNPTVAGVILVGITATAIDVQEALTAPTLIVGHWGAEPASANIYMLSHPDQNALFTVPGDIAVTDAAAIEGQQTGSEIFGLKQFPDLRDDLTGITVIANAVLPDADFSERYINSDIFVDPPGLLVTLGYDAVQLMAQALQSDNPSGFIESGEFVGINGEFTFSNGYWSDAPIYFYRYSDAEPGEAVGLIIDPRNGE